MIGDSLHGLECLRDIQDLATCHMAHIVVKIKALGDEWVVYATMHTSTWALKCPPLGLLPSATLCHVFLVYI